MRTAGRRTTAPFPIRHKRTGRIVGALTTVLGCTTTCESVQAIKVHCWLQSPCGVRIPAGSRQIFLLQIVTNSSWAHPVSYSMDILFNGYWGSFTGIKRPGGEADYLTSSISEVKIQCCTRTLPSMPSWHKQGYTSTVMISAKYNIKTRNFRHSIGLVRDLHMLAHNSKFRFM